MSKHLKYDEAATPLFLDHSAYPPVSGVSLSIFSDYGGEILASTAQTIYPATTIDAAISYGDTTITLAAGSTAVQEGDLLQFENPKEVVEVDSYDSAARILYLKDEIVNDRLSGDGIYGASLRTTVDTTGSDYENGQRVILVWEIDDEQRREIALVSSNAYSYHVVLRNLNELYPSVWALIEGREFRFIEIALDMFRGQLALIGVDIDSMPDSAKVDNLFTYYAKWLAISRGGERWIPERDLAWSDYVRNEEAFTSTAQWQDKDHDNSIDREREIKTARLVNISRTF